MPKQPNLLFVFGDEWRGQSVGYIGNADVHTPNLDRLAAEGCAFEHCIANVPVCTPSRGTILTGLYPLAHGAVSNDLPVHHSEAYPSIARALGESGYRRAYIGKWHLGGIPRYRFVPPGPERLGFDDYWASWNCHHNYTDAKYFLDEPEPVFSQGYEPTVQTDLALTFLDDHLAQHKASPFCLYLSWGPPHFPYRPLPPGFEGMYDPAALTLRPNVGDTSQHRSDWDAYMERVAGPGSEWARVLESTGRDLATELAQREQDFAVYRQDLADYYGHISALDAEMGRLLTYLEDAGILDDTLVVFTSDHGTMLGSHGHVNKQLPWEESINVPLLIRYPPKIEGGSRSDLMVGLVDLTPTLMGLLDVDVPRGFDGHDLSRHVVGDTQSDAPEMVFLMEHICCDQVISSGIDVWRGVRTPRYTYARDINGPWLLYDNREDTYQQHNLIASPDHTEVRAYLDGVLKAWLQERQDPFLDAEGMLDYLGLRQAWRERNDCLYSGRDEMSGAWPG